MAGMQTFQTDYAVATGEYISEWIEDTGSTLSALARDAGIPVERLQRIVLGEEALDLPAASAIKQVTELNADALMRLEAQYQTDLERLFTDPCRQAGGHDAHRYRVESAIHWCPGAGPAA